MMFLDCVSLFPFLSTDHGTNYAFLGADFARTYDKVSYHSVIGSRGKSKQRGLELRT